MFGHININIYIYINILCQVSHGFSPITVYDLLNSFLGYILRTFYYCNDYVTPNININFQNIHNMSLSITQYIVEIDIDITIKDQCRPNMGPPLSAGEEPNGEVVKDLKRSLHV